MKILIGADFVPTQSNAFYFENSKMNEIIDSDLLKLLETYDYRIFNLENPLTNYNNPISKSGINLRANPISVNGYKQLNVDFLTLANNHIYDYGHIGLMETIDTLKKAKINYAGVGNNIHDASVPYILNFKGEKIGIYCCAEHEFSIADEYNSGANPFDAMNSLEHIRELRLKCDYLIVLYHGGKEHYEYPAPYLQKTCKKIIEYGADIVICQHSHCVGCRESYLNGTIIYGQGNFLFDDGTNLKSWYNGILVGIDTCTKKIDYYPLTLSNHILSLAKQKEGDNIINEFNLRSQNIEDANFVNDEYIKICNKEFDRYLLYLQGNKARNKFFRLICKLTNYKYINFLNEIKYDYKSLLKIINILDCEVHRDCFLYALKQKVNNKKEKNK